MACGGGVVVVVVVGGVQVMAGLYKFVIGLRWCVGAVLKYPSATASARLGSS